jgi:LmbE family N-acetylglucosaminyl deacetylase
VPEFFVDISQQMDKKTAALAEYDSQLSEAPSRSIGDVPPAEFEMMYHQQTESSNVA